MARGMAQNLALNARRSAADRELMLCDKKACAACLLLT